MKKKSTARAMLACIPARTVERMLFESNLRQSIEQSLQTEDQLSDMERQDYINQINSLQATIKNLLNMIDTLRQTLDSVNASSKRNRPNTNIIPGTHGTLEFVADLATDAFQVLTPNYREGIRMKMDKFTCCQIEVKT